MRQLTLVAQSFYLLLLGAGLIIPVAWFLMRISSGAQASILVEPNVLRAFLNTLRLATLTSISSTLLAFSFSWLLWRFEFPLGISRKLSTLLKLPYLLPPFLFAMGWIALAAPEVGYLNQLLKALGMGSQLTIYSLGGAAFVLTLWSVALGMIQVQPFFDSFPGHLEDAAILCGASPRQVFLRITMPLARMQLSSCMLLSFISAVAAFGVPAMLASPARDYVLTTRIFQSLKTGTSLEQASEAGVLSITLLLISALLIIGQYLLSRRAIFSTVSGKATRPSLLKPGRVEYGLFSLLIVFTLVSVILPCLAMALQSLLRDRGDLTSISFDRYKHVFFEMPNAVLSIQNSLLITAAASLLSVTLASFLAYAAIRQKSSWARVILEVLNFGYALPGTVIALSLLVFFSGSLTDTLWIFILAYLVKYAAFAVKTIAPALANLSPDLEEAGWMSGANPWVTFSRITLKLLAPALSAALLLSFLPMFSELTMSVFLAGPSTETIGVLIYRFQEYADPGSAAVLGVLLALVALLFNVAVKALTKGRFGI